MIQLRPDHLLILPTLAPNLSNHCACLTKSLASRMLLNIIMMADQICPSFTSKFSICCICEHGSIVYLRALSSNYSNHSHQLHLHNYHVAPKRLLEHDRPSIHHVLNINQVSGQKHELHKHQAPHKAEHIRHDRLLLLREPHGEELPTHTALNTFSTINPFSENKNLSNIRICTTNIRGMKIGTEREAHKLQTVINTNSDVVILIDHHLDQLKLASLTKNNRQILSKFTIHGTPSLKRGILVLVKKSCGCKITNVQSLWENDIMSFDIILPDMSVISTLAVYTPSHKDI